MADTRTRIINLPEATTLDPSMNFVEDSADGSGTRRVTYDTLKRAINQEGAVNLAPAYSNAATYNVGDLCTYQGTLYTCNTQISTAEDWTAAHWTLTNMASDLYQLKSDLKSIAEVNVTAVQKTGFYVSDGKYVASDLTSCVFVIDLSVLDEMSLMIKITGTSNRCRFLYTNTPAAEVAVGTSGTYVDNGNSTTSVTINYNDWSKYKTLVVCTNYRSEPYATLTVNGYLTIGKVKEEVDAISDTLANGITEEQCTFFKNCEQLLKSADASADGYWNISNGTASRSTGTGQKTFPPIKLTEGTTYRFIDVYGYFCIIADASGNNAVRLTDVVTNQWSVYYTPSADCYIYMTVKDSYFGTTAMMLNDTNYLPDSYTEGIYYSYFIGNFPNKTIDIHVKQDGTGDYTSVVDAVTFANSQKGNYPINIYIHTGDYDILEELGGDNFLATVLNSADERQGLVLKADNINLIGVGLVTLRYELADNVEYYQSSRTSCLNLREFSNRVENLTLIAKNCRYTIHDETNGGNPYIHRVMKNLRCIHKGNAEGLWPYPTVMGGGAGGGSTYDVINCQFITSTYHRAFSYHSGANQEASMFNIDGCIGSVKADAPTKTSFRLSYHGTGRTGISVGNIKNCSGNGQTVVQPESSGDADNNIEMYVNGWESIEPIAVTGNE